MTARAAAPPDRARGAAAVTRKRPGQRSPYTQYRRADGRRTGAVWRLAAWHGARFDAAGASPDSGERRV